ncbi:FAD-dependent oxidoreductase [Arvimicrobium flavum]|uniref:FAD-dependent oxidoreductase n=1 Tax=Arvimicrobium flavum TaxID=3393320 RepID=UPI00237C3557|nr:FAD-dependent oxidoreductase [Mesorhizobium shangrilense]
MPQNTAPADREDVIVIGAGPSGLAASLALCRGGVRPLILERDDGVGGLMRSLRWRDFIVDLGRKELYTRFPEVDTLWSQALGEEYGPYPHRVGSLYQGRIVELSSRYRGMLRGIPPSWLLAGGWAMLRGWLGARAGSPSSYEAYWHGRVGSVFARVLAQGYWEKFRGRRWSEMAAPEPEAASGPSASGGMVRQALSLARRGGVQTQSAWRHPMRGTGQLFETFHRQIETEGGRVRFHAEVVAIRPRPGEGFEIEFAEGGKSHLRTARKVISSLPIERLVELLGWPVDGRSDSREFQRSVILVYLFLDEPPRFPHAWLEVNDPDMPVGRVTNYAAFGGGMVPAGHTALCVEFFCQSDDAIMARGEDEVAELAIEQLASCSLIDRARLIGTEVRRLPRTNAAASWREQQTERRQSLLHGLTRYPDLYHVNRPGSDWASLAGLLAAQAILTGDRKVFDVRGDPTIRHTDAPIRPDVAAAARPVGAIAPSAG